MQHIVQRRRRQRVNVGKACHELLEVGDHRLYLGLLQHDLGNPHRVGGGRVLPGQIPAPVALVPRQQPLTETGRYRHHLLTPVIHRRR